jgi:hypothetical protein
MSSTHDKVVALRRIEGDAYRQELSRNEGLSRDFETHYRRPTDVRVRVKVPFGLGFGRIARVGEIVSVKSDDAAWLTAPAIAWAEKA